jgi:23S rRNA-/tRNA-specific pseudouridylate synthase
VTGGRTIRRIVRPGEESSLGEVVCRAGGDPEAIAEGRVFVGRQRARDRAERVPAGAEVTIQPAGDPRSTTGDPVILHHAGGVLAALKPAGLATIPDLRGDASLLRAVARIAGLPLDAVHPTSRLDRDVSGVVVFALDAKARERLRRAREAGQYARHYVAVSAIAPDSARGAWDAPIGRHPNRFLRAANGPDASPAETRYRVVECVQNACVLAVQPVTGRTHQIRVHASHAGAPLLGDRAYGGAPRVVLATGEVIPLRRIFLHAARVVIPPSLDFWADIPAEFRDLWTTLGGRPDVWEKSTSCETS